MENKTVIDIHLDASKWSSIGDFYDAVLPALGAPPGHGRCPNALIDSIIGGGMNAVEPPYTIVIAGTASLDKSVLDHLETVKLFLAEAREEQHDDWNRDVDATIEIIA